MRKFAYILLAVLLSVGCSFDDSDILNPIPSPGNGNNDGGDEEEVPGDGPNQNIKRRPIVPNGKLQRPRFRIMEIRNDLIIRPSACGGKAMTLTVRCEATGFEQQFFGASEADELIISCNELQGEVVIITEIEGNIEIEYFILAEK